MILSQPTTGLDARAALHVATVIRRIADSGRTVLMTIHQPSAAVFLLFDRLLLLQAGGQVVYNGDIGNKGETLEQYFADIAGKQKKAGYNVAACMFAQKQFVLSLLSLLMYCC